MNGKLTHVGSPLAVAMAVVAASARHVAGALKLIEKDRVKRGKHRA